MSVTPHVQSITKAVGDRSRVGTPDTKMKEFIVGKNLKVYWTRDIGERRLEELRLRENGNVRVDIEPRELGEYSIMRVPVLVAMTGKSGSMVWRIVAYTHENIDRYFGHCYVVTGKKIRHIGGKVRTGDTYDIMKAYEAEECGRLEDGHTNKRNCIGGTDIFRAGMGHRTRPRVTSKVRNGGTISPVIVTRRFENSRLTCVCKSTKIW